MIISFVMLSAPGAFFFLSCFNTFSILSSLTILLRSIFSACDGVTTDDLSGPKSPSASLFRDSWGLLESDPFASFKQPILGRFLVVSIFLTLAASLVFFILVQKFFHAIFLAFLISADLFFGLVDLFGLFFVLDLSGELFFSNSSIIFAVLDLMTLLLDAVASFKASFMSLFRFFVQYSMSLESFAIFLLMFVLDCSLFALFFFRTSSNLFQSVLLTVGLFVGFAWSSIS